jgi:outer membrane protein TolC
VPALAAPEVDVSTTTANALDADALSRNPDVLSAEHHVLHEQNGLREAKLGWLPDFTLEAAKMDQPNLPGYNLGLLLSVPLYFGRQKAEVKSAELRTDEMVKMLASAKNEARWSVRSRWADAANAARTSRLFESAIVPRSRRALEVVSAGYPTGKASFLDLMDAEHRLLSDELEYRAWLKMYAVAAAQLRRARGAGVQPSMGGEMK